MANHWTTRGVLAMGLALALAGAGRAADPNPPPAKPGLSAKPAASTAAESQAEFAAGFETGLLKTPVYAAMKKYYPDVYARSLQQALKGLEQGKSILALQADLRGVYTTLLKSQLPKAEPRLVREMIDIARAETESLVNSPADCMAFVGLAQFKTRPDLLLPPELSQRDLKLSAEILEQTATHPYVRRAEDAHELPSPAQLASIAYDELPSDDSRRRFVQIAGDLHGVTEPPDQRVVCEYMIGFFSALLKQTPEDAAALY
ncbi:MAG: hypothetical protein JSS35_03305, partial [Proteobacteria bacterium]|nr:hypothetical protein [Pseudomonadota bacterium]